MAGILQPLKSVIVEPLVRHTATVIFIHGLGDTGHGWKPVADMFKTDPALNHIKWVLPHAPIMPVTANMGMEMPSWFDLYEFGFRAEEDEKGMLKSMHAINQLITVEVDAGVPANRIVLGGFSQGGGLTLLTGLTSERTLAGLVVLSGWSPIPAKLKAMATDNTRKLPVFWGHGKEDPLIKFQFAQRGVEFLTSGLGIKDADSAAPEKGGLIFRAYDGLPHSTNPDELRDLKEWLKKIVPNQS